MHDYLDSHQTAAVEALFELKRICDKHQIRFYLLAGTTLGAVRHQGMIPWDDDIDVGFLPEDLHKLQAVIREELDPRFEYASPETDPGFPRLFGKILLDRQSCVDLFLIVKWTNNNILGHFRWQMTRFCVESYYQSLNYVKPRPDSGTENAEKKEKTGLKAVLNRKHFIKLIRRTITKCCFFLTAEDFIRLARWNEKAFSRKGCDCYVNLYSIYGMKKERIRKEWIETTSEVTFEGKTFTTVGDTHAYLTHLYGDYMQLPPEEARVRERHSEVFAKHS